MPGGGGAYDGAEGGAVDVIKLAHGACAALVGAVGEYGARAGAVAARALLGALLGTAVTKHDVLGALAESGVHDAAGMVAGGMRGVAGGGSCALGCAGVVATVTILGDGRSAGAERGATRC